MDKNLKELSDKWVDETAKIKYGYNFKWMGRPIIQLPQDIIAMQEIIWEVKPDLIIETGIAHGGSLVFSASMLELIGLGGKVLGIDIDIREHNYEAIINHPMHKRISMLEGSSIDEKIAEKVKAFARNKKRVIVCLDSNHTHEHVLRELELYAPLVTKDSYCVVFDTNIENASQTDSNRPWGKGNNPKTAVDEFLKKNKNFVIDKKIYEKLLISAAPDGYLKRIK